MRSLPGNFRSAEPHSSLLGGHSLVPRLLLQDLSKL